MPRPLKTQAALNAYVKFIIGQAAHHGTGAKVIPILHKAIMKKVHSFRNIRIFNSLKRRGRSCWITVKNGNKYAFRYDHKTKKIVLHEGHTKGIIVATFDDQTPAAEVKKIISKL